MGKRRRGRAGFLLKTKKETMRFITTQRTLFPFFMRSKIRILKWKTLPTKQKTRFQKEKQKKP